MGTRVGGKKHWARGDFGMKGRGRGTLVVGVTVVNLNENYPQNGLARTAI